MMVKRLARFSDLHQTYYISFMQRFNAFAAQGGLLQYTTYSRIWEYPWLWEQVKHLSGKGIEVLDIGSEKSPFPWFLAENGFRVTVSDLTLDHWQLWQRAEKNLNLNVQKRILNAQSLDVPTASKDIYLSISVIEHVPGKKEALKEAARVLRPGGMLVMTFDICEPDMGMSFPEWNGKALTMKEFDDLFAESPWFDTRIATIPWNTEDIPEYLAWHRTTEKWHNYITGATVVQRNKTPWTESCYKDPVRMVRGWGKASLATTKYTGSKVVERTLYEVQKFIVSPRTSLLLGELFLHSTRNRNRDPIPQINMINKILVIRLDEIGDVILTSAFLRELRRSAPEAWITLVVKPGVYNLVEHCPYVNEVITFSCDISLPPLKKLLKTLHYSVNTLRNRHFDLAIIPRWDTDIYNATHLAFFSSARWRIGFSEKVNKMKQKANQGYDQLLTLALNENTLKHEVLKNLDILSQLQKSPADNSIEAWLTHEDESFAHEFLSMHGVTDQDIIIAIGPYARQPKRQWSIEKYQEIAAWIVREYQTKILVVGGKEDIRDEESYRQLLGSNLIFAVGYTTLRQTASLLKLCRLYIGNDTGPMHLAASVHVPVIEISCHPKNGDPEYANSPERFGPWSVPNIIVQPEAPLRPCSQYCSSSHSHCIETIHVDMIKKAVGHIVDLGLFSRAYI